MTNVLKIKEIKEAMVESIEKTQEMLNKEFEKQKQEIQQLKEVAPVMLGKLVEIYGNSKEQKDLMVDVLKDSLTSQFAKESSYVKGANYVYLKNGEYYLGFSCMKEKEILIGRKDEIRVNQNWKPTNSNSKEELELMQLFNSKKEIENQKIVDKYCEVCKQRNLFAFNFKTMRQKLKEIEKFVSEISESNKAYSSQIMQWEENMEKLESESEVVASIMQDINEDISKFKNEGWKIRYENIINLLPSNVI